MLQSIAGTYKNGVIQLANAPANIQESKVIVTFLDSTDLDPDAVKFALSEQDDENNESPAQSFREGLADVVAGNTVPASTLWD